MGNIYVFILIAYVLYYAGQIIYDLFFLKDKNLAVESEGELVSIQRDAPDMKNVGIDDIEDIEVPSSYDADDSQLSAIDEEEEPSNYDIEAIRKSYEEEEELERYSESEKLEEENMERSNHDKTQMTSQLLRALKLPSDQIISSKTEMLPKMTDSTFDNFVQEAASLVVMESTKNGHKVFKSSL